MRYRILVIDDSPIITHLVQTGLSTSGYDVKTAATLAELDTLLGAHAFDAVVVDVNMPEMYGDDLVEFLREQRRISAKLVLYSDLPAAELEAKRRASGADAHALKADGLDGILSALAQLLPSRVAQASRILVVDDSPSTAALLKGHLVDSGHDVVTALSAAEAMKIILKKKTRPNVVLLDVHMPGVDGEAFCHTLKSNSLFADITVILCSGTEEAELKALATRAHANGYILKDGNIAENLVRLMQSRGSSA
jgi:CheY-like chemotaxis protein